MKYINIIIGSILLFSLSCKKIDKLTQFELEYNETVIIESSFGINTPFNIYTPDIETNSESEFAINDTRKDLIEEIILKRLTLELISPNNADFSFLESINIYISTDSISEIKIAWKENINGNGISTLELETTDKDLKDYIKADNFSLRVNTVTDEVITVDHEININSIFDVDAKILGQ